jgi:hypothetical protein
VFNVKTRSSSRVSVILAAQLAASSAFGIPNPEGIIKNPAVSANMVNAQKERPAESIANGPLLVVPQRLAREGPNNIGPGSITTAQIVSAIERGTPAQIFEVWRARNDPTMSATVRRGALTQVHDWLNTPASGRMGELFRGDFATASSRHTNASSSDEEKVLSLRLFCNWLAGRPYSTTGTPHLSNAGERQPISTVSSATLATSSPIRNQYQSDLAFITQNRNAGAPGSGDTGSFRSPYFSHAFDMAARGENRNPDLELVVGLAVARWRLANPNASAVSGNPAWTRGQL